MTFEKFSDQARQLIVDALRVVADRYHSTPAAVCAAAYCSAVTCSSHVVAAARCRGRASWCERPG
jgi:hypothetical protein